MSAGKNTFRFHHRRDEIIKFAREYWIAIAGKAIVCGDIYKTFNQKDVGDAIRRKFDVELKHATLNKILTNKTAPDKNYNPELKLKEEHHVFIWV